MKTADFDYDLPPELIAQTPVEPRDHSRLMVLNRNARSVQHCRFFDLPNHLQGGDVLVFNDTRVIPARLRAAKPTGAELEILLLHRVKPDTWLTLVRPAKRAPVGTKLTVLSDPASSSKPVVAEVVEVAEGGSRVVAFQNDDALGAMGSVPLPPYIHEPLKDPERYQTVYARIEGSAAAPTAGLHFTPSLLEELKSNGVGCVFVTLHVGLDTFQPVREENPERHRIHREYGAVSVDAWTQISRAKADGRRVICVGTTAMRLLEAAAQAGTLAGEDFADWVDLFILPGYKFKVADAMITNFHLPRTTLIMLVSAFAGKDFILDAYREAIEERYRFYSFGDAMLIL
jgi:S-adenosylmethionine:tRNA ribosyltransferase-isomerase